MRHFLLLAFIVVVAAVQRKPQEGLYPAMVAVPDLTYLTSDEYVSTSVPDYQDITYKKVGGTPLKLDIFLPSGQNGSAPAVVYIHSGAWVSGSKETIHSNARKLVPAGFALVSIDYRLVYDETWDGDYVWPAQGNDVADAVRWLKSNGPSYGVDPGRLGCWGESAGGQLCLWLASAGAVDTTTKLNVAVNMFGVPCMLCWPYRTSLSGSHPADWYFDFPVGRLQQLMNDQDSLDAAERSDAELVQSAEATYNIVNVSKKSTAPTFIGHGDADDLVPAEKASFLARALSEVGVDYQLVLAPGGGHEYENWPDDPIESAVSFVQKHIW